MFYSFITERRLFCYSFWPKYYMHPEEGSHHPSQGLLLTCVQNVVGWYCTKVAASMEAKWMGACISHKSRCCLDESIYPLPEPYNLRVCVCREIPNGNWQKYTFRGKFIFNQTAWKGWFKKMKQLWADGINLKTLGRLILNQYHVQLNFRKIKGPRIIYSSYSHNWSVWALQNLGNGERVFCELCFKHIFPIKFLSHGTKQQQQHQQKSFIYWNCRYNTKLQINKIFPYPIFIASPVTLCNYIETPGDYFSWKKQYHILHVTLKIYFLS